MKKSILIGITLLILTANLSNAQTAVTANTPLKLAATVTGGTSTNTTGYRLYVDGTKVGADIPFNTPTNVGGTLTLDVPGQPVGPHTLQIGVFNNAFNNGQEFKSSVLNIVASAAVPPPVPVIPTNLRITIGIASNTTGGYNLSILNVTDLNKAQ